MRAPSTASAAVLALLSLASTASSHVLPRQDATSTASADTAMFTADGTATGTAEGEMSAMATAPAVFEIVILDTTDSDYRAKLYVPSGNSTSNVTYPTASMNSSSSFSINNDTSISVVDNSTSADAPKLYLYLIGEVAEGNELSLVASPLVDNSTANYTLLNSSLAMQMTSSSNLTFITLGAGAFFDFDLEDDGSTFEAEPSEQRDGPDSEYDDGDGDDDTERFNFVVVEPGTSAMSVSLGSDDDGMRK